MRRIIIIFIFIFSIIILLSDNLVAQEIKWRNHRFEASYSYDYLDHQEYGDWHKLRLALYTDISPTFTYFVETGLFSRKEGEGILGTVGIYKHWSNLLYTYSALSAGSNRDYLHRFRADHDFNFRVGKKSNYVLTAGTTYVNYSDSRYDIIVSGGVTLYLERWLFHYRLFYNHSNPGSMGSYSHLVNIGYGQEYRRWTYLNVSWGRQAYVENALADPERINEDSLNVALQHRHWLGKHHGFFSDVSYFNLKNEYDKYSITFGVFYNF